MAEKSFGRVIEDRRHELGLTQEVVAKKVGVKANYIGYLERGMRHPSQKVVERLSGALKLDPQELYLLANPRVRSLLGKKAAPSAGPTSAPSLRALLSVRHGQEKRQRSPGSGARSSAVGSAAGERGLVFQASQQAVLLGYGRRILLC